MTRGRAFVLSFAAMAVGVVVGRALPREAAADVRSASPRTTRAPGARDRTCETERAELATLKAQLGACMAYARPRADPAPALTRAPAAPAEPQGMDAILAMLPEIRAESESARELVYVKDRNGRIRAYRPEEWPPEGGDVGGARIIMRKLADGTWESYDPSPEVARMAGPAGRDGLVTLPDGTRVRYVFTDGGAQ